MDIRKTICIRLEKRGHQAEKTHRISNEYRSQENNMRKLDYLQA